VSTSPHPAAAALLGCLLAVTLVACSTGGAGDAAAPSPDTQPPQRPGAADDDFAFDIDTLELALQPTFEAMGWVKVRIHNEITALSAVALLPDGREADIRAQQNAAGGVDVQVVVGLFGASDLEQRFLAELHHQLAAVRPRAQP